MKKFKEILSGMSNEEILSVFKRSISVSDFCRNTERYSPDQDIPGTALKYSRVLAEEVGFDLDNYSKKAQYEKNPKLCKQCGKPISWLDYSRLQKVFCDSSCAASYTNKRRERKKWASTPLTRKEDENHIKCYCSQCGDYIGVLLANKPRKICDSCLSLKRGQRDQAFEQWRRGEDPPSFSYNTPSLKGELTHTAKKRIKEFLLEENDHKCAICGCSDMWNNSPLTFILDHINGDWSDQRKENLRLICPNCNSQLETTKSKKVGTGRLSRRLEWQAFSEKIS